jgi:Type IV secretion system pilin
MNYIYWFFAQVSQNDVELPKGDLTQADFQTALRVVFGISGAVAVIFVVIGGLKYIMSQGNPSEVTKAKDTIVNALIGLAIVIASFGIISFVVSKV